MNSHLAKKSSLYKIMLNSDSDSGYLTSEDECSPCQQGMACEKGEEDDLYKIISDGEMNLGK